MKRPTFPTLSAAYRNLARLLGASAFAIACPVQAALLDVPAFTPDPEQLVYIQRSLTLLNSGTPTHKPDFRLLFYGNSHVTKDWCRQLGEDLKVMYPNVNIIFTNKAIVAFDSVKLMHTAVADIGLWQPDLVVVTSYGSYGDPELGERNDFIPFYQRLRSLGTADVMVFPPHLIDGAELAEPSYPGEDADANPWYQLFYVSMPRWANASGHCWANIRTPWKEYLLTHQLPTTDLLDEDRWHVNVDGGELCKILLRSFLKPHTFAQPIDPWNNPKVRTATVGTDIQWTGNALDLRFKGSRVDVVYEPAPPVDAPTFTVTLDGKDPKDVAELYGFDRASSSYGVFYPMPGVIEVLSEAPLVEEAWKLHIDSINTITSEVNFSVTGSKTGFDGSGTSFEPFVSKSRRIRLEPYALTAWWAYTVTQKHPTEDFNVQWNAVRRSVSTFKPVAAAAPGRESTQTLFSGASETAEHRLLIRPTAGTGKGIRAIRVYSTSGVAAVSDGVSSLQVTPSGSSIVISWPVSAGRGTIESSAQTGAGAKWSSVAEATTEQNGRYRVTIPIKSAAGFYRWRN